MFISIEGIESLDYMRLHRKYSWKDEPSWKLDAIGEKYVGINKIEYDGNLDDLFEDDIQKFIEYNFRDVEILKLLDEKLQYIALTKNLAHKGKHNYSEVYANTITQDGAISAYLLVKELYLLLKNLILKRKKDMLVVIYFALKQVYTNICLMRFNITISLYYYDY